MNDQQASLRGLEDSIFHAPSNADNYKLQLETISNNATLALFIMDERQQCVYMNPAAEQLTGFTLAELQGRALHDVIHHTRPDGSPYPLLECPIDQAFPQNNQEQGEEVFVHKDGSFYPVAYTASPMREGSAIVGTIIEVRDITAEKLARRQREELDRQKIAFFSNVSHELRTPLTLILGPVADALSDTSAPLPPAQQERLQLIERNAQRLLQLVNTLLDFSRIEAGRTQAIFAPTDLATLTADIASMFRAAVERVGLRFVVDCPPLPRPVHVDHDMWEKIVSNLLSNALKFTFEGEISLQLRVVAEHVELVVRDTGEGIPADELPRLFERFHRVLGARARSHEGSGIGLALVNELVRFHGGSIDVASSVGQGSSFVVCIPLGSEHLPAECVRDFRSVEGLAQVTQAYVAEALRWMPELPERDATQLETPVAAGAAVDEARPRVLLADDNADMRDYVERLLQAHYEVRSVADGRAAFDAARAWLPDLMLTDVMMPELNGIEVLQQLRADPRTREIPIVMLSARAGESARVEGLRAGADDYLIKPFGSRELLARVSTTIELAQLRREAMRRERRHAARLRDLADASLAINAQLSVVDVLQSITDRGRAVVGAHQAVSSLTVNDDWAQAITSLSLSAKYAAWHSYVKPPDGSGIYALVCRTNQPMRLTQAELEAHPAWRGFGSEAAVHPPMRGWLAVPLIARDGRNLGLIQLSDKIEGEFNDEDELTLVQLAQLASVAIENARLYEAAQEAVRTRDEFLSVAAHELKTPVTSLRLAAQGLQRHAEKGRELDAARLYRSVELIDQQSDKLRRLTDQLLDIARLDSGRLTLDRQPTDVVALVREVMAGLQATTARHRFSLAAPAVLEARVDALRVEQVLTNVLTNAIKYSPDGGAIDLVIERPNDAYLTIGVTDQGIGIPEELRPHIFDRFFQAHAPGNYGGMGLGLYISKHIMELHGGRMELHFPPERGTSMVLWLPLASDAVSESVGETGA